MDHPHLYLASASPRRRALIGQLGLPYTVGVAPVDEPALEASYRGPVVELAEYLARHKAQAAALALDTTATSGCVVVGADTTVVLDGISLGKPRDVAEAEQMLHRLRDRAHLVVTGVALVPPTAGEFSEQTGSRDVRAATVTTTVHMRDYSDQEIAAYLATGDSLDKAGAYAVQHGDFQPVAAVEGCYLCVVGFPLCAVTALLAAAGINAPALPADQQSPDAPCGWCDRCRRPLPYRDHDAPGSR